MKALVGELKHDTSFKRRAAAEALEEVDDPRATQPLLAALSDQDPTVRVSAIHALGKDAGEEVTMHLRAHLSDPESCVRLAAAEVLAKRLDPALARDFLGLLADQNFEVRLSAIQFLGRIRDPEIAAGPAAVPGRRGQRCAPGGCTGPGHYRRADCCRSARARIDRRGTCRPAVRGDGPWPYRSELGVF